MRITVDEVMRMDLYPRGLVDEMFGGLPSVTAHDVAGAPVSVGVRAWVLSQLLGTRDKKREVARRIARDALGDRDIPADYRAWLDTGDDALRPAAWDAAGNAAASDRDAVWDAVWNTAWVAAGAAAGAAAGIAALGATWAGCEEAQRGKYIGWMAEWLDSHEKEV